MRIGDDRILALFDTILQSWPYSEHLMSIRVRESTHNLLAGLIYFLRYWSRGIVTYVSPVEAFVTELKAFITL